ncbi:hypothetical protein EX30DRAFT_371110 [Ascodesmis nigricans]|uniref:Uncharacterized protein n=1 Tax=Ascodesmis nigricans TaxID=341454 RepID=A0A4S2MZ39_9PEZI|nr:hypothetical protein EX30DRAFT_371110 [Ascodesmis nigricans]
MNFRTVTSALAWSIAPSTSPHSTEAITFRKRLYDMMLRNFTARTPQFRSSSLPLPRPYSQTGYPNSNKTTNPPGQTFSKDENTGLKGNETNTKEAAKVQKKTQAQSDEELRQKLEEMSGGGGVAGLELEDGRPVAMKRGVAANMFRLI